MAGEDCGFLASCGELEGRSERLEKTTGITQFLFLVAAVGHHV